jgi:hypothetical protein
MTSEPEGLREAVERNAQAVVAGNFAQLMADITPEALAQMMQMAPAGGGFNLASMPSITGCEVEAKGQEGDAYLFHVILAAELGRATLGLTWKQILGQWKVTGVALVSLEPAASSD